jgi:hypothetical protein
MVSALFTGRILMPTADIDGLKTTIEAAFEQRATIDASRKGPVRDAATIVRVGSGLFGPRPSAGGARDYG